MFLYKKDIWDRLFYFNKSLETSSLLERLKATEDLNLEVCCYANNQGIRVEIWYSSIYIREILVEYVMMYVVGRFLGIDIVEGLKQKYQIINKIDTF